MSLEITKSKLRRVSSKSYLLDKITALREYQVRIAEMANTDQRVFDSFRSLKKAKKQEPESEQLYLNTLKAATHSPLEACKLLRDVLSVTSDCIAFCNSVLLSDLKAGILLLEASFKGILSLADGNINSLPPEERDFFQRWKIQEEHEGQLQSKEIQKLLNERTWKIKAEVPL